MFSENEEKALRMIRENDNPEEAVFTAIKVFAAFLEQLEVTQEPQAVCLQGFS